MYRESPSMNRVTVRVIDSPPGRRDRVHTLSFVCPSLSQFKAICQKSVGPPTWCRFRRQWTYTVRGLFPG